MDLNSVESIRGLYQLMMRNPNLQASFDSVTFGHNWLSTKVHQFFFPFYLMTKDFFYG